MTARPFTRLRSIVVVLALCLSSCTTLKRCAYEGQGRDEWQKPEEVIQALAIRPGDRVADLGSGGGYFTFRLAKAVGPEGVVYAVDVDQELNEYIAGRARHEGLNQIRVVLAQYDDPLLPQSGIDMIFLSNTYHHLENRVRYFANARKYLRPEARVAIIDFKDGQWLGIFGGHYTPSGVIKKEMTDAGYQLDQEFDFLPQQHFLVFSKKAG